jgi:hypothetical protein
MSSPILVLTNKVQVTLAPVKALGQAITDWHNGMGDAYRRFRKIHPVWGAFTECLFFPMIALCSIGGIICGALLGLLSFCWEMIRTLWYVPLLIAAGLFIIAYTRCALVLVAMEFLKKALF